MTPEEREARKALTCLYLAATDTVADDVKAKVEVAFAAIREECAKETARYEKLYYATLDRLKRIVDEAEIIKMPPF